MEDETILSFRDSVRANPRACWSYELVIPLVDEIIRLRCQYEDMIEPSEDNGKCPVCGALTWPDGVEFDYTP